MADNKARDKWVDEDAVMYRKAGLSMARRPQPAPRGILEDNNGNKIRDLSEPDIRTEVNRLTQHVDNLHLEFQRITKAIESTRTVCKDSQMQLPPDTRVEDKIKEALEIYDADKTGVVDYALESSGATITSTPDTRRYPSQVVFSVFGFMSVNLPSNPRAILQPDTRPGECFSFYGAEGRIRIRLSRIIFITDVTLEHAPFSLLSDIRSAPKNFTVYGLTNAEGAKRDELGQYVYGPSGKPLQTFRVDKNIAKSYQHVELHILSNYGHPEYTCVYRFRVHGTSGL